MDAVAPVFGWHFGDAAPVPWRQLPPYVLDTFGSSRVRPKLPSVSCQSRHADPPGPAADLATGAGGTGGATRQYSLVLVLGLLNHSNITITATREIRLVGQSDELDSRRHLIPYSERMPSKEPKGERATTHDTVDAIASATRRSAFPVRRAFIQQKDSGRRSIPGPLASFVAGSDLLGLRLYFLAITKASEQPWDMSLHSAVLARALGLPKPTSTATRGRISKAWTRLVERNLVSRGRRNRLAEFTLLAEDGSGDPYTRPTSRFINVPHEYWTSGPDDARRWYEVLKMPELTFLVIALSNLDNFPLPAERGPEYYGISADTLQRGATALRRHGLLDIQRKRIKAPLAPEGYTYENRYTLKPPFGPKGEMSAAASPVR